MDLLPNWRSLLFLPTHNHKFVHKAHTRGADAYVLDLEDSVPSTLKDDARKNIKSAALTVSQGGAEVLVRINSPLRLAVRDLEFAVCDSVKAIVLPKITNGTQVKLLADVIEELEVEHNRQGERTGIIVQIEDVDALPNLDEIATASSRLWGMTIGSEDFATSAGMEPIPEALLMPNQLVLMACRRANIMPLGFPASIADYSDLRSFRATINLAKKLGFVGAFCIHPSQVEVLNTEFVPSEKELRFAKELLEKFDLYTQQNKAVFEFKGKMIDAPVVARARHLLQRITP
ncbi:HpcH/HpaI aldolase/citrate lyase family protein [Paraglaciecola arctica]|uniref:HpcH/HpaI aldolase/citrate lyase family protein n=1 Tax=Paraglaciecola arctica TaxID=1128911 RepID=UPI001C07DE85|nr:CoA ester lyase [Paraglaciecola arctica]MBU3001916.1 CoA ester lyase [Paraglaciecola arctica]